MERAALRLEEVGSRAERTEGAENRRQPWKNRNNAEKREASRAEGEILCPGRRKGQVTLEFFLL